MSKSANFENVSKINKRLWFTQRLSMKYDCHILWKYLVFQSKYLAFRTKTLDFDQNTRYFEPEISKY